MQQDFEKLGVFYLGKRYDPPARQRLEDLVLYDSRDLVTHAVCVGMTGSGKTGLCVGLLEEAAIDGVPAIVIDPKGDLSNLLLTFPQLRAEDFRPWVNEQDAARKGQSPDEFAAAQAEQWKKGLGEWGQDGERIARLRGAAEFEVYTPGSSAGTPVSILKSFACPPDAVVDDGELFKERIATTATSLLGLLGIEADPIKSREHILISTILHKAWSDGRDLDLGELIRLIQDPGPMVQRIGVMELEGFYPAKERFELAMGLNNLLAAPGFEQWMEGAELDVEKLLHSSSGKPRVAIFSIAHLGDAERMFFVSLLLSQVLGWVRQQSGTTSLRAILYMDEIAGYCPPTANPPSKGPLLTLMKQARAFGVGVVLATQNPVDLDYKGLSNAGTWFIGRLQTERDKGRVLDGLEGAAASGGGGAFDRATMDKAISGLANRVFLMNNVHEDGPVVFETRWCMSYLRGPLTRSQLRLLKQGGLGSGGSRAGAEAAAAPSGDAPVTAVSAPASKTAPAPAAPARSAVANGSARPVLAPDVPQFFVPVRGVRPATAQLVYQPKLLGTAKLYFADSKLDVNHTTKLAHLADVTDGAAPVDWDHADPVELEPADLAREPEDGASGAAFAPLPGEAGKAKSFDAWKRSYGEMLFRTGELVLFREPALEETSKPGEDERTFRARLGLKARELRDAAIAKAKAKFSPKLATLQERLRKAEQAVEVQRSQALDAKLSTAASFGSALLGALLGRKTMSAGNVSRAASAARGVSRSAREAGDVGRAQESVEAVRGQIEALDAEFKREVMDATGGMDPASAELETVSVRVKKTNVSVTAVVLAWVPVWVGEGRESRAW